MAGMLMGEGSPIAAPGGSCEIAAVLFTDIVSYSTHTIDRQSEMLTGLQQIVKASGEFQKAKARDDVISLPTGDGMALVFFGDPIAAVRCALEIAEGLRSRPELGLRMGIHSGPVFRHADIKDELNVVGGGINMAQRVMDCGDAGHILLSANVAEVLQQFSMWRDYVQDFGVFEVKHGIRVHVFNLCKDGLGNAQTPHRKPAATKTARAYWKWLAPALGVPIVAAAIVVSQLKPPPPPPQPERTLTYYILKQEQPGKPFDDAVRLGALTRFKKNDRIRLMFRSPESGYLYILYEPAESKPGKRTFITLFPSRTDRNGSALIEANQELRIPQDGDFHFEGEPATESLWLVWSRQDIVDLDGLKKWINQENGGNIGSPEDARMVAGFLDSHTKPEPVITVDESDGGRTAIKGKSDIMVALLHVDHD